VRQAGRESLAVRVDVREERQPLSREIHGGIIAKRAAAAWRTTRGGPERRDVSGR
jgi:hypothetical protein